MPTISLAIFLALVSSACASSLAEVQDEDLAAEQEMLAGNAADIEEDTQEVDIPGLDNEDNLDDQQIEGEDQQFSNQDQQFQQNQQFSNQDQQFQQNQQFSNQDQQFQQNQQFSNQDQQFQQNQQFSNQDQQFQQNQQFSNQDQQVANQNLQGEGEQFTADNTQQLNEGEPAIEEDEAAFTEVGMTEGDAEDSVAAADAEGVPVPNKFSGAPPLPGTLKNLASGEAPVEYRIELGDTLYDICEQLLAEPEYWPKLWAMNDIIKNPHFVYPDFVLQFFPGDANRPPAIGIIGVEELTPDGKLTSEELVADETAKLFEGDDESDLELLNPEDIVVPPEVLNLFRDDDTSIVAEATLVQLPALILPDKLNEVGEIVGGLDGAFSIQDDNLAFVRGAELESSRVYTVLRYQGGVQSGLQHHGYRYDFVANIRVEDFTGEAGMARAQVFSSVTLTRAGDIVVEYRARSRRVPLTGMGGSDTRGRIINFTHSGQQVAAMGDFAFLIGDVGSDFVKNQVIRIFKNNAAREGVSRTSINEAHQIGTLQVIEVTEQVAISYIIGSSQEIMLGDVAGSG